MAKKAIPKNQNQGIQILNAQINVQKLERYQIQIDSWRSALQSAENIYNPVRKKLYEIYNEILLDAHLSAIVSKRIRNVKNKKIVFVEKDGKVNEQTNELFEAPFFRDLIEYIMETIFWGHTLVEFEFFDRMIDKVHLVPRQHVRPELGIIGLTSPYDTQGINYKEEPYNKFTLEIAKKDLGLLNIAAANAIFKKYGKVDFANFVEMFGSPTRKFTYDYMNPTAQVEANKVAKESGNSAAIVMPRDLVDLELVASSSSNSTVHLDFLNSLKSELSVLILGQTMTTENGSSRSQAEVHQNQQNDIAFDDMQFVEYVLNWDLKEKLIGFGYPLSNGSFKFDTSENLSIKEQIEIDLQLKNLVDIDPSYFYEKYNLPKPKESKEPKQEGKKVKAEEEPAAERNSSHQKKKSLSTVFDSCCRNSDTEKDFGFDINLASFVKSIFEGKLKKGEISKPVFNIYNEILQAAISEGYENVPDSDKAFYNELSYNQSVFAAFKTHSIGDDLAKLLTDEKGELRTFSEFQKAVNPLLDNYNQNWLRAEYNTSVASAQAAKKWQDIQRDKDLFPYLEFRTQNDNAVRSEHKRLHGIIRKVDDAFWNTHYPPLGFNCRCTVRKLEEGTETKLPKDLPQPKEGFSENVGKTARVFDSEKSSYSKGISENKVTDWLKQKAGITSKLPTEGTPLENHANFFVPKDDPMRADFEKWITDINKVFPTKDLPTMKLYSLETLYNDPTILGRYIPEKNNFDSIIIKRDTNPLTFFHEISHAYDYKKGKNKYASEKNETFFNLVSKTAHYKSLEEEVVFAEKFGLKGNQQYYSYLALKPELYARALAQHIALNSENQEALNFVIENIARQWTKEDFETLKNYFNESF